MAILKCIEYLLKVYCESTGQILNVDLLDGLTVDALAKATENASRFKGLWLHRVEWLSDRFLMSLLDPNCATLISG